jgi:effector-binding domain-containing protein
MSQQADPEVTLSPMRVQTVRGFDYFYMSTRATMETMMAGIGALMPQVMAVQASGQVQMGGPLVFSYVGGPSEFELRVGFPVPKGTIATEGATVATMGEFRCASLIYCGPMSQIGRAFGELMASVPKAGLAMGQESREWYLYFEDPESANNVTMLQVGLA